jgi:hypothetical protein
MRRNTGEMIDINGTPMTLTHETVEYFPDKLKQISFSAYEASERLERFGKKTKASLDVV